MLGQLRPPRERYGDVLVVIGGQLTEVRHGRDAQASAAATGPYLPPAPADTLLRFPAGDRAARRQLAGRRLGPALALDLCGAGDRLAVTGE